MILTIIKILIGLLTIGLSIWALYTEKPKHRKNSIILIILLGTGTIGIQISEDVINDKNENKKIALIQQNLNNSDSIYTKLLNLYSNEQIEAIKNQENFHKNMEELDLINSDISQSLAELEKVNNNQLKTTNELVELKEKQLETFYSLKQAKFSVHLYYEFTNKTKALFEDYIKPTKYDEDTINSIFKIIVNKDLEDIKNKEYFNFKITPINENANSHGFTFGSNPGPLKKYFSFGSSGLLIVYLFDNFHISNDLNDRFKTLDDLKNVSLYLGIDYHIKDSTIFKDMNIIDDIGIYFGEKKLPSLFIPFHYFEPLTAYEPFSFMHFRDYKDYYLYLNHEVRDRINKSKHWHQGSNNFFYYYENLLEDKSILNY